MILKYIGMLTLCLGVLYVPYLRADLADTIKKIKPAVVAVGVYEPMGAPKSKILGTGFVIGDGQLVVTNFHVVPEDLDYEAMQKVVVFTGTGQNTKTYEANVIASSADYDLAVLKVKSKPLPAMTLASNTFVDEGTSIAFTGFPMGSVLGLYPVTHKGIVSAVTPTTSPVSDSRQITLKMLKRMRDPYLVYQLDATAYPGNSGSALYDTKSGEVIGVINKVFVQGTKEAVISNPSGITYAIPVKYLHELLKKNEIAY